MSAKMLLTATIRNKRGRVISVGTNSYLKTHTLQKHYADKAGMPEKPYLHAEVAAIIKMKGKEGHKITIERYGKSGQPLNAKPCPICELAIKAAGIKFVEYTVG